MFALFVSPDAHVGVHAQQRSGVVHVKRKRHLGAGRMVRQMRRVVRRRPG
jgi:hypothetical protein